MSNDAYYVIAVMLFAAIMLKLNRYENKDPEELAKWSAKSNSITNSVMFVLISFLFWMWGMA